jgi:glycosyltransferase involved in cell wall biosynthesis
MTMDLTHGRRVAIVHYWLVGMRGGERVIESLCRMFPQADLITHVAAPDALSDTLRAHRIIETRIGRLPMARRMYQKYLPLMPRALEEVDLTGYDLVISSESGPAKGVIAPPDAPHLCYCHSPMRYLWDQYHVYRNGAGRLTRAMMPPLAHRLRQWDVTSAARVDGFAANSAFVAARIQKYWRREADVVAPPVSVEDFAPVPAGELGDFYLWAGELAPYKRPDLAVEAFARLDKPLVVIGGPDKTVAQLKSRAGPKTRFLGKVPFAVLKDHMARCRALIFPGEEDFGIVPVEVMASGRPVIAYGRGGILDTVVDGETGLFFNEQSVSALADAVSRFEASGLARDSQSDCLARAALFSEAAFQQGIARSLSRIGA